MIIFSSLEYLQKWVFSFFGINKNICLVSNFYNVLKISVLFTVPHRWFELLKCAWYKNGSKRPPFLWQVLPEYYFILFYPYYINEAIFNCLKAGPLVKFLNKLCTTWWGLNLIERKSSRIAESGFEYLRVCSFIVQSQ